MAKSETDNSEAAPMIGSPVMGAFFVYEFPKVLSGWWTPPLSI